MASPLIDGLELQVPGGLDVQGRLWATMDTLAKRLHHQLERGGTISSCPNPSSTPVGGAGPNSGTWRGLGGGASPANMARLHDWPWCGVAPVLGENMFQLRSTPFFRALAPQSTNCRSIQG